MSASSSQRLGVVGGTQRCESRVLPLVAELKLRSDSDIIESLFQLVKDVCRAKAQVVYFALKNSIQLHFQYQLHLWCVDRYNTF